jgi:hypothetical protein
MTYGIGPVELLVYHSNNRLRKPVRHINQTQARAVLEELAKLLDRSMADEIDAQVDAYSIINTIRFLARTPSDYFELQP